MISANKEKILSNNVDAAESKSRIFIDGSSGTVGLELAERIARLDYAELIPFPANADIFDLQLRKSLIEQADIAFLCLPDAAAKEICEALGDCSTVIIDASTAHRTAADWAYGFPELSPAYFGNITSSRRICTPGCHASGFIALIKPLIDSGLLDADAALAAHSLTGYSGGGRSMIDEYEAHASDLLDAPNLYSLTQGHKHLPEMKVHAGLRNTPYFRPIVGNFYRGMLLTVPLFASQLHGSTEDVRELYRRCYPADSLVHYEPLIGSKQRISANSYAGRDDMAIGVLGNSDRIELIALYDNLGKGAAGAAIECLNIVTGHAPELGLSLQADIEPTAHIF